MIKKNVYKCLSCIIFCRGSVLLGARWMIFIVLDLFEGIFWLLGDLCAFGDCHQKHIFKFTAKKDLSTSSNKQKYSSPLPVSTFKPEIKKEQNLKGIAVLEGSFTFAHWPLNVRFSLYDWSVSWRQLCFSWRWRYGFSYLCGRWHLNMLGRYNSKKLAEIVNTCLLQRLVGSCRGGIVFNAAQWESGHSGRTSHVLLSQLLMGFIATSIYMQMTAGSPFS